MNFLTVEFFVKTPLGVTDSLKGVLGINREEWRSEGFPNFVPVFRPGLCSYRGSEV